MSVDTRENAANVMNMDSSEPSEFSTYSQVSGASPIDVAKKLGPLEEYEYEVPEYQNGSSESGKYFTTALRVFPIAIAVLLVPVLFTSTYGDDSILSFKRHYCAPYIVLSAVGLFYAILQIAISWMSSEKLRWAFWPGLVMVLFYIGCIGGGSVDSSRPSSTALSLLAAALHLAWLVLSSLHLRQLCCFELLEDDHIEYLPLNQKSDSSTEFDFLPLEDRHWTRHADNALKVLPVLVAILAVIIILLHATGASPAEHGIPTIILAVIALLYSPLQNLGAHRKRNLVRWAFWVGIPVAIADIIGIVVMSALADKDPLVVALSIISTFLHISWICIVGSSLRLFCCTNAPFQAN